MPRPDRRIHYAWVVLGVLVVIMITAGGLRASFGVFIKPMEAELGWSRTSLSIAAALSLLVYGLVAPFAGRAADLWGAHGVHRLARVHLARRSRVGVRHEAVAPLRRFRAADGAGRRRWNPDAGDSVDRAVVRQAPRPRDWNRGRCDVRRAARHGSAGD